MMKNRSIFGLHRAAVIMIVSAVLLGMTLTVGAKFPDYPGYKGKPVTLTMWAWTSNENYSIDAFQKAYPNIKVKWDNFGVHYNKLLTATTAGKGLPDVIMSEYTYASQYMDLGAFQPINKWIPVSRYNAYFPAASLKWVALDNNIYGTPQDSGAITMVYRKDIFDKYGLKVPTTWDEFAEQAIKLHNANPRISFTTIPINWVLWPMGMVWQAGGRLFDYANKNWYVDFTNPISAKVFNYWNDLVEKKAVRLDMWWSADWYKGLNDGDTATVLCGAWYPEWLQLNSPQTKGLWRVAVPPQWDPAKPQNGEMGGSGFYVSSQSKNPAAAALFVLWLNSHPQSLAALHDRSQLPVLVSKVFKEEVAPKYADFEHEYFGGQKITPVILKGDEQVKTSFVCLPVMDFVQSSVQTELQKVNDGKQTLKAVPQNWEKSVVDFMKKQGYNNLIVGKLP